MVDGFEVETLFPERKHERHQFKLEIEGKYYKGDYHDGEIHWLHPHPKQVISDQELAALEQEVLSLLGEEGIRDETDEIEVEKMLKGKGKNIQMFKLKIQGESFKGTFQNGNIEWFHPKPRYKMKDERVEEIEKKVQEKLNETTLGNEDNS